VSDFRASWNSFGSVKANAEQGMDITCSETCSGGWAFFCECNHELIIPRLFPYDSSN
jgi:hypothetical protein